MLILHPTAAVLGLLAVACTTPTGANSEAPRAAAPASLAVTPTSPLNGSLFDGANITIPVPARTPGTLFVDVESRRTARETTVTVRAIREVDCGIDKAQAGAPLYTCTTRFDRVKTVPASAFTYDGALGTATLTTTVDGKPLSITWTGYGTPREQVNTNGALLIRNRDASAAVTWGRLRWTQPQDVKAPGLLYHRVTAST